MNKFVVLIIAIVAFILGAIAIHFQAGYEGREQRLEILDAASHNQKMNECVAKVLEKHPGAVLEVELEKEDGQWVFDIDVQGNDGKTWDVECDINTAEIIEDSIDRD